MSTQYLLQKQFRRYENTLNSYARFTESRREYSNQVFVTRSLIHDLSTPLSSVHASLMLLEKSIGYEDSSTLLRAGKTSIESAINMVRDASIKRGDHHAKSRFGLRVFMLNLIEIVNSTACKFKIKIYLDSQDDLWAFTYKTLLERVLLNLIQNAIEELSISSKDERSINLSYKASQGKLEISVEDNGGGIKEEDIFKIFHHGSSTKRDHQGIGLHYVKRTLENSLNGSVRVESKLGKGTKFILRMSGICKN